MSELYPFFFFIHLSGQRSVAENTIQKYFLRFKSEGKSNFQYNQYPIYLLVSPLI
jgi:hypothetical protein